MRFYSYLNSGVQILNQYKGEEPFASFIKKYFSANKKHGSKDRKQITHLCYCYFRLGKSLLQVPVEERILIGLFLCSSEPNEILAQLKPEWNVKINLPADKKLLIISARLRQSGGNYSLLIKDVFPWKEEVSPGINYEKFCESFFVQPDLFLRLRPGYENIVKEKLLEAAIDFKEMNSSCLSLPNASKIEDVIALDREIVVQDYSSQQIGVYFKFAISNLIPITIGTKINAWDCCAASGGKSLLLHDINPNIDLTVTDLRESILINLKKRFTKAGIKKYKSFVTDLTSNQQPTNSNYDLIICDAPCTGSGTWSRTPEQLYFFEEKKIEKYAELQKKIVSNVIPHLRENGFLVYMTCSVFKKENEEVVKLIREELHLELIKMPARMAWSDGELFKGYDKKADTMFAALFRRL
jgi:16S rRNA (cytosine967-C5)-methyltransferase